MTDKLENDIAIRVARAYIGYTTGLSDATMKKQIPDDAEVGDLWVNTARFVIAHMRKAETFTFGAETEDKQ